MKSNITKNVSILAVILSLMFGLQVYAEDSTSTTPPNSGRQNGEFRKMMEENKEEREGLHQEFKEKFGEMRDDLKANREQYKLEVGKIIESIKEKRQEFKSEIEANREQMKTKITEMRAKLKEDLKNIKDEGKQKATENIVDLIQELNTKITDNLAQKVDQIENVLVSIESRINKAKENGIDVSSAESKVDEAKNAISNARDSIKSQATKIYETNITDETTLRTEMQTLRDTFKKDINVVQELVKKAHTAVKNVATALAQIPKIDEASSTSGTN